MLIPALQWTPYGVVVTIYDCIENPGACSPEEVALALLLRRLGCGCFTEGTLVATPQGLRAIEDIAVGDQVLAWNPDTGETSTQTVTALIRPEPQATYALVLLDGGGEREVFTSSADHPWFVVGKGWVETVNLASGDRIVSAEGADLVVQSLTPTERTERTFNLEVSGPHTFLVGEDGAVVHNACLTHLHHLLPKQFAARFRAAGLNIENFRIPLAASRHVGRAGIHGGPWAQGWNGQWAQFFRQNPNATSQQIMNQLSNMRSSFGI